jgi:hypothetical protein
MVKDLGLGLEPPAVETKDPAAVAAQGAAHSVAFMCKVWDLRFRG